MSTIIAFFHRHPRGAEVAFIALGTILACALGAGVIASVAE
ncbi:hypothetical protein PYV02_01415 [Leifsonia sp. H3M29-4]|nr:hypothetical protein [Salinibacterium metalliresistens]MDF1477737.1 hypothetical protein [Salinibacterium metalliresistens]